MSFITDISLLRGLNLTPSLRPHGSNILTKCTKTVSPAQAKALEQICSEYISFEKNYSLFLAGTITLRCFLGKLELYYALIRRSNINVFSHQSDFLSSLLPEFLLVTLQKLLQDPKNCFSFLKPVAQTELGIELNFNISNAGTFILQKKRMDLAICSDNTIVFNSYPLAFQIPVLCAEIKTNIDKNMLFGIESSVETLKRTFPKVQYFAIGEFCDFDSESLNYASTGIDEIFILRRQKRSDKRSSSHISPISIDVLERLIFLIEKHLRSAVLTMPSLNKRMKTGVLTK